MIGENKKDTGNRSYSAQTFSAEVQSGVGTYFEKEVYSAFANPLAAPFIEQLVNDLGGPENVTFQVFGYATGGFCVDAFASGLAGKGYKVQVILDATAAIGGEEGMEKTRQTLPAGCECITTEDA